MAGVHANNKAARLYDAAAKQAFLLQTNKFYARRNLRGCRAPRRQRRPFMVLFFLIR